MTSYLFTFHFIECLWYTFIILYWFIISLTYPSHVAIVFPQLELKIKSLLPLFTMHKCITVTFVSVMLVQMSTARTKLAVSMTLISQQANSAAGRLIIIITSETAAYKMSLVDRRKSSQRYNIFVNSCRVLYDKYVILP